MDVTGVFKAYTIELLKIEFRFSRVFNVAIYSRVRV